MSEISFKIPAKIQEKWDNAKNETKRNILKSSIGYSIVYAIFAIFSTILGGWYGLYVVTAVFTGIGAFIVIFIWLMLFLERTHKNIDKKYPDPPRVRR